MRKINDKQRGGLAEFCANFAVAWLAVGIIPPVLSGAELSIGILQSSLMSIFWAGFSLILMLSLLGVKKT